MKLIKTSFFSAIITFIKVSSGFVAGKVVALVTGPAGVALIGQFTNFITIVLTFANGAINNGVVKYTAEYDGDEIKLKKLFSTSFKISVCCSAIIGVVLLLLGPVISFWLFNSNLYVNPTRILGSTIIFYALNSLLISILNGKKQIKTYTIVNTVGSVIGLLFTIVLVFIYKIQGALYALVLAQSIVFFVTLTLILKTDWFEWSFFKQSLDKEIFKNLSKFSLMAIVSAITVPISQIILRNMITKILGIESAGYWQGIMRISDGYLLLVTTSLATYYLPKLSSLFNKNDLRKEIFDGYKIIMPIVIISCIIIFLLKGVIVIVLFSQKFAKMTDLFLFQLIGDIFKIAAWLLAYVMLAKAMTRIFIITEVIFSISYIIIGYFCITHFGIKGITIAFAINYIGYFITMLLVFRKTLT